jgi:hypothetical protein
MADFSKLTVADACEVVIGNAKKDGKQYRRLVVKKDFTFSRPLIKWLCGNTDIEKKDIRGDTEPWDDSDL